MSFSNLVQQRYSCRAYKSGAVPDELLDKVLETARLAPTAANRQPFRILVIQTKDRKEELKRLYSRDWFVQAPLVLGVVAVPDEAWTRRDGKNYADVDATIAMDHLILAAADFGLGTCWIAAFDPDVAREIFQLPADVEPIAFTPLGFPDDELRQKKRKALDEILRRETWS